MPKAESAFFKANPFSGPEIKETPRRKWSRLDFCLYLEEEDNEVQKAMTRSLNKARKTYQEFFAQDVQDVDAQEPSSNHGNHGFGRGFAFGRGQPVPSRWFLLGGSRSMVGCGKTTRKKAGPTSKKSCDGKLFFLSYFPVKTL